MSQLATTLTIPKALTKKGELVILPRHEYEAFLEWKKVVRFFTPTAAERRELKEARRDFDAGQYVTLAEL